MSDRIVGLRGRVIPDENGAEPKVVEALESALAAARRGEIISVGMALVRRNFVVTTVMQTGSSNRHLLAAGAAYLLHDLAAEACE